MTRSIPPDGPPASGVFLVGMAVMLAGCQGGPASDGTGEAPSLGPKLADFAACHFRWPNGTLMACGDEAATVPGDLTVLGGNWICVQEQQGAHVTWAMRYEPRQSAAVVDWQLAEAPNATLGVRAVLLSDGPQGGLFTWNSTRDHGSADIGLWDPEQSAKLLFLEPEVSFGGVLAENATWHPHWIDAGWRIDLLHTIHFGDVEYYFSPHHSVNGTTWIDASPTASVLVEGEDFGLRIEYAWIGWSDFWQGPPQNFACNI